MATIPIYRPQTRSSLPGDIAASAFVSRAGTGLINVHSRDQDNDQAISALGQAITLSRSNAAMAAKAGKAVGSGYKELGTMSLHLNKAFLKLGRLIKREQDKKKALERAGMGPTAADENGNEPGTGTVPKAEGGGFRNTPMTPGASQEPPSAIDWPLTEEAQFA